MEKSFTNESVKKYILSRKGWDFVREYHERGGVVWNVGVRFRHENGWGLSIIAGENFYCSPRKSADEYRSVELAILKGDNLWYGDKRAKFCKCDVEGYIDWETFEEIVKYVEKKRRVGNE